MLQQLNTLVTTLYSMKINGKLKTKFYTHKFLLLIISVDFLVTLYTTYMKFVVSGSVGFTFYNQKPRFA